MLGRVSVLLINAITNPVDEMSKLPNGNLNKIGGVTGKTGTPKILPVRLSIVVVKGHRGMENPFIHTVLRVDPDIIDLRGSQRIVNLLNSRGLIGLIP